MRLRTVLSRTLHALCVIVFTLPARTEAQSTAHFQPLTVPPPDVGTCLPPLQLGADSGAKAAFHSRLVMTNRTPGARRDLSILRDNAGRTVGYTESVSLSTGNLASVADNIVATLRPDGRVTGFWMHISVQMSDSGRPRLDTASLRAMRDQAVRHSSREPLDTAAQRKVRALVTWLGRRCPE